MDVEHRSPCGEDVAPYALGALEPAAARRFEEHLAHCELCRADLEALRPTVDALATTPEPVAPPPDLRRRLMAVVEQEAAERRRAEHVERPRRLASWLPRPVPAMAAACVLLVAGIGLGVALRDAGGHTYDGKAPAGVRATLTVDDRGEIELRGMDAPRPGRVMQVWLMREGSDRPEPTDALFTPNADGEAHVAVPGDMDDVTRVLISEEPAGGSTSPTTAPSVDFRMQ